jgi:hypothetical protein
MEDVVAVIQYDAVELRVIAGDYTFVIKRPKSGWGISPLDNQEEYTEEFLALALYNASYNYAERIFDKMVADQRMQEQERDKYINHILSYTMA